MEHRHLLPAGGGARNFPAARTNFPATNATTAPTSSWRSSPARLWDSWSDDALVRDPAAPLFADPEKVCGACRPRRALVFKVRGPLNVSRSPQGRPVFLQAGAVRSRARTSRRAGREVVFVKRISWRPRPRANSATTCGRGQERSWAPIAPTDIKVLPGVVPIVAETRAMAEDRRALLDGLADPQAGLSTLLMPTSTSICRSSRRTKCCPTFESAPACRGHYREVADLTRRSGVPLRELRGDAMAPGARRPASLESARDVVGHMEELGRRRRLRRVHGPGAVHARRAGGFCPGWPCPRLQQRGLFHRTGYTGATLREHLGLARPECRM